MIAVSAQILDGQEFWNCAARHRRFRAISNGAAPERNRLIDLSISFNSGNGDEGISRGSGTKSCRFVRNAHLLLSMIYTRLQCGALPRPINSAPIPGACNSASSRNWRTWPAPQPPLEKQSFTVGALAAAFLTQHFFAEEALSNKKTDKMLKTLKIKVFKSLENVTINLGIVNVLIGANGSGKSNLLEAMRMLSCAADGRINDKALLSRGVRLELSAAYKTEFPPKGDSRPPSHLFFSAASGSEKYKVSLQNPTKKPNSSWRFKPEVRILKKRMAALKAVEFSSGTSDKLLELLQAYVIFSPATAALRGLAPETKLRDPLVCPAATFRPRRRSCFANVIRIGVADEFAAMRFD